MTTQEIKLGDCRELAKEIADSSIDMIFTDPPYHDDMMWVWPWLSEFSSRVLKPGGWLFTFAGKNHLDKVVMSLSERLVYWWQVIGFQPDSNQRFWSKKINGAHRPVLIYYKEPLGKFNTIVDARRMYRDKRFHQWGQGIEFVLYYMDQYTQDGDLVCDPFTGGGTTLVAAKMLGLNAIGFEIDESEYGIANTRLEKAQELYFTKKKINENKNHSIF